MAGSGPSDMLVSQGNRHEADGRSLALGENLLLKTC
jgi:hypothetical protein